MSLATLGQLKEWLGIPQDQTQENDVLEAVLGEAERYILELSGLALTAEQHSEIHQRVIPGRMVYLSYRPVSQVSAARMVGSSWESLDVQILDSLRGVVVVLTGASSTASLPPPSIRMVKFEYTAGPYTPPQELSHLCLDLAATWYRQNTVSNLLEKTVGEIRERYREVSVPPRIIDGLSRYMKRGSL